MSRRYCTLPVDGNLQVESSAVVGNPKGKQAQVTSYYDPNSVRRLKALSEATHVPQSVYLREALEDLLKKHATTLRKAK